MYVCVITRVYTGMPFRAWSSPAGGRELSRHSQSLTVAVEVGYSLGAPVGSPKSDFPRKRPESANLPLAQSGSDWDQKVSRFLNS